MKKVFLVFAAAAAISFTSCKNNKKGSDMNSDKDSATMSNKSMSSDNNMSSNNNNADKSSMADNDMNKKYPTMTFNEKMYDFGKIKEGDVVKHEFDFKNTGDAPLKVLKARGSCGCTIPSWSKKPIAPGETGKMMVRFNSRGKKNNQMKSVRITTNTKSGKEMIRIKAFVQPKNK